MEPTEHPDWTEPTEEDIAWADEHEQEIEDNS